MDGEAAVARIGAVEKRISTVVGALALCVLTVACEGSPTRPVGEAPAAAVTMNAVPATPGGLTANATIAGIELTWTDVANETSYQMQRALAPLGGAVGAYSTIATPAANTISYTDAGAAAGTRYRYRLRARNADGNSPWAYVYATGYAPPKPPVPADFAAMMEGTAVALSWTDGIDETSYQLQRALAPLGGSISGSTTLATLEQDSDGYTDEAAAGNTRYRYRIRACNPSGCSGWATLYITTPVPPLPGVPADFAGVPGEAGDVVLTWTDGASESRYELQRAPAPEGGSVGSTTKLPNQPAGTTTYTDAGAQPDTRYRYRIRACNTTGCSDYATVYVVTPPPPPPATVPTDFAAAVEEDGDVVLTWTDSENEARYELQRALAPSGSTISGNATIASPAADATTYTDESTVVGTRYRYRLRACNAVGCSGWATLYVLVPAPPPPTVPGNFAAAVEEDGDVVLTWSDATNETGYQLHRALAPEGGTVSGNALIASPAADVTTYTDESTVVGTRYRYRLRACNAVGCSAWVTLYVLVPAPPPPPTPTDFAAILDEDGNVALTWTDVAGETGYQLQRALAPEGGSISGNATIASPAANATAFTDQSTPYDTRYRYRVRACNAGGCSSYATLFFVTTPHVIDFETWPDGSTSCDNCSLTDQFAELGVIFSFASSFTPITFAQLVLTGPHYDPPSAPDNHSVSFGGGWCGTLTLTFPDAPERVRLVDRVNAAFVAPWTGVDGNGNSIAARQIVRSDVHTYTTPHGFLFAQEVFTISDPDGVSRIEVDQNVVSCFGVHVDDLTIYP
jgi:titin